MKPGTARTAVAAACAVALGAGCTDETAPERARFWTLFDFTAALGTSEPIARGTTTFPDGVLAEEFVSRSPEGNVTANVATAFSEGGTAAYLTTEIWSRYDAVWVQPMYILVGAWDEKSPGANRVPGADPIFSVGRESSFYSPYWQVFYAVVPEGKDPARYTSAHRILDDGLALHPGPGRICALQPHEMEIRRERPFFGDKIGNVKVDARAWLDGEVVWYMDFGSDRFRFDASGVVAESPLYVFARRDERGRRVPIGLPTVGGTGGRVDFGALGQPAFGSLWRAHTALLPTASDGTPVAGVFVPNSLPELRKALSDENTGLKGVRVPPVSAAAEAKPGVQPLDYLLRVALNPACFEDVAAFPDACRWLDSEEAIRTNLSHTAIVRGDVTLACAFVTYGGRPVPNP